VLSSTHWDGNTVRIRTAAGPSRREAEAEAVESSMGSWKAAGTAAQEAAASARGWQRGCGAFPVDGLKGGGAAG